MPSYRLISEEFCTFHVIKRNISDFNEDNFILVYIRIHEEAKGEEFLDFFRHFFLGIYHVVHVVTAEKRTNFSFFIYKRAIHVHFEPTKPFKIGGGLSATGALLHSPLLHSKQYYLLHGLTKHLLLGVAG